MGGLPSDMHSSIYCLLLLLGASPHSLSPYLLLPPPCPPLPHPPCFFLLFLLSHPGKQALAMLVFGQCGVLKRRFWFQALVQSVGAKGTFVSMLGVHTCCSQREQQGAV